MRNSDLVRSYRSPRTMTILVERCMMLAALALIPYVIFSVRH
jgi:hypothetical protein